MLPGNSAGTFLVRDSESTPDTLCGLGLERTRSASSVLCDVVGHYALSVRNRDPEKGENIKHYRLARTDAGQYYFYSYLTKKPKYFYSLDALVQHFSGTRAPVPTHPALPFPCLRDSAR